MKLWLLMAICVFIPNIGVVTRESYCGEGDNPFRVRVFLDRVVSAALA